MCTHNGVWLSSKGFQVAGEIRLILTVCLRVIVSMVQQPRLRSSINFELLCFVSDLQIESFKKSW